MKPLFKDTLKVINVGLAGFGDNVVAAGGECVMTVWQPPALGDRDAAWALAQVFHHAAVEHANQIAFARFLEAHPVLIDVALARDVIHAMASGGRLILHAGPPIAWSAMCGPMRGAVLGAILFERWADTIDAAARLVDAGSVALEPCHHHGAVGPMAGEDPRHVVGQQRDLVRWHTRRGQVGADVEHHLAPVKPHDDDAVGGVEAQQVRHGGEHVGGRAQGHGTVHDRRAWSVPPADRKRRFPTCG